MNSISNMWCFIVVLALAAAGDACTCAPRLLQQQFCDSEFIIRASPYHEYVIEDGAHQQKVYNVSLINTYKVSASAKTALKSRTLHTAVYGSLCGVNLIKGMDYLIGGSVYNGEARVSLCHLSIPWNTLTINQQNGVQLGIYKQSCSCRICGFLDGCGDNEIPKGGCRLNDIHGTGYCFDSFSSCRLVGPYRCAWKKSQELTKCLKPPKEEPFNFP